MVLVTGGTGMLGAHLIEHLHTKNIPVRALYRSAVPEKLAAAAEWVPGDILDVISLTEAMQGISEVYHCAGFVSFSPKHKADLYKINVEGTANVVNACLDAGVKKLLHVSSVAALGKIKTGLTTDEKMIWTEEDSNSEYGKSKYLGEMEVWRGIGEGLPAVIINPSIIFGHHGDWEKGSMAIFKTVYKEFPYYSTGTTGFVDADDIARAAVMLMDSDIESQRFIVSAENRTYQDLFFMIADAFGKKRPHKMVTPFMASVVWRLKKLTSLFTGKDPMITKETAATALAVVNFDNGKLLKALPAFTYTPLEDSVKRIAEKVKR